MILKGVAEIVEVGSVGLTVSYQTTVVDGQNIYSVTAGIDHEAHV
jgi:hypothetical protein